MRDDEVTGVDPSVFRKYFREDGLEEAGGSDGEDAGAAGPGEAGYNRAEVRDYKMPRRKTTKRKKHRKPPGELERSVLVTEVMDALESTITIVYSL